MYRGKADDKQGWWRVLCSCHGKQPVWGQSSMTQKLTPGDQCEGYNKRKYWRASFQEEGWTTEGNSVLSRPSIPVHMTAQEQQEPGESWRCSARDGETDRHCPPRTWEHDLMCERHLNKRSAALRWGHLHCMAWGLGPGPSELMRQDCFQGLDRHRSLIQRSWVPGLLLPQYWLTLNRTSQALWSAPWSLRLIPVPISKATWVLSFSQCLRPRETVPPPNMPHSHWLSLLWNCSSPSHRDGWWMQRKMRVSQVSQSGSRGSKHESKGPASIWLHFYKATLSTLLAYFGLIHSKYQTLFRESLSSDSTNVNPLYLPIS